MALTITVTDQTVEGNKRVNAGTFALDTSYPAGGYPITAQAMGLVVIDHLAVGTRLGYEFEWDKVNKTLRCFNGLQLTASQVIGTPVQTDAQGNLGKTTAGALTVQAVPGEIATGTNLSTVTNVPWVARGV